MPPYLVAIASLITGFTIGFLLSNQLAEQQQATLEKSIKVNQLIAENQKRTIKEQKQIIEELEQQRPPSQPNTLKNTQHQAQTERVHIREVTLSCPPDQKIALSQAQQQINELQKQVNNRAQLCLSTRLPPEALNKVYNPPQKQP